MVGPQKVRQLGTEAFGNFGGRAIELRPDIGNTARADRWKFFRYQEDLLDLFMDGLRKAGLDVPDEAAGG